MTTLTEIESAIERLPSRERAKLSRWWQERFDLDEGLELRAEVADELKAARQEIHRGEVADWEALKRQGRSGAR